MHNGPEECWDLTSNLILTSGTRLGSYEILGAIGAGGMGEVYARAIRNSIATSLAGIHGTSLSSTNYRLPRGKRCAC